MPLRAAVFDFDGVIVDSEPLHFRSLADALRDEEVAITREEYWGIYLAYDDWGAIRRALEHHGREALPERVERVAARKLVRFAELIPEVPTFEGAPELIRRLAAEMPLAIASGARHEEVEAILRGLSLLDCFAAIVGAEDAARTKPDPAPYLEAARRLARHARALAPADCVAFEDSLPGILSARAAGMRVVGVTNSYPAEKLQAAHSIVPTLADLGLADLHALFG